MTRLALKGLSDRMAEAMVAPHTAALTPEKKPEKAEDEKSEEVIFMEVTDFGDNGKPASAPPAELIN